MDNIILLILAVMLTALVVMLPKLMKPKINRAYFTEHWQKIINEPNTQVALVSADSLLDQALKQSGFRGNTMGERLKSARPILKNNNDVWWAHKLRNRLVHEPGTQLNSHDAKRAISIFKKALKNLGAL